MSRLFEVVPAAPFLPDAVAPLAAHADHEGIRIVSTVRARWAPRPSSPGPELTRTVPLRRQFATA